MKRKLKIGIRRDRPRHADRARMLAIGTVAGIGIGRLIDPVAGRRRRTEIRDRTRAFFRRAGRRVGRFGRFTRSHAVGIAMRATHVRQKPKDFDDATLADKIRSEIFRPADVPKGQINVNVQRGVAQLRGEVPPEMIGDLEAQVRRIQGVRDVENLLHPRT